MRTSTNYFVCSLGEAANVVTEAPSFRTINDLLGRRASETPDSSAIGFFQTSNNEPRLKYEILTFCQVLHTVQAVASRLVRKYRLQTGQHVALLSSSSPEFLLVWLACVWLGYPILLIAPECSSTGVAALCHGCGVPLLISDKKHRELASNATAIALELKHEKISLVHVESIVSNDSVFDLHRHERRETQRSLVRSTDIAYLHHSSGTSSGTPKPIAQSHHGAVGALPNFRDDSSATFTTTPLYHGGPADIFRAWTSGAMVWLFPTDQLPVTANNVIRCLESAQRAAMAGLARPIKYFTSVPYILQIMAESEQGLSWLQNMDLVGVGGAALARDIGDGLVSKSVNLVSRYGSAECGFLMSSHRDYEHDRDWQYLRMPEKHPHLKLEPHPSGLSELIVLPGWPHMAKTNRQDGSYATADLFEPHNSIPNAWRYHSRADSQLTLVTGKKFDPAPIEDAITAASSLIADSLVFGDGRPYPGVLIFRSLKSQNMNDSDVITAAMSIVGKINKESQAHVKLSKTMLIAMPFEEMPLEKTSKGTVLRSRAADKYKEIISQAYSEIEDATANEVSDHELPTCIKGIIQTITHKDGDLEDSTDLFSYGIDSISGMQIRRKLQNLLPSNAPRLPINIVEDCGTVHHLARYISDLRNGERGAGPATGTLHDVYAQMTEIVQEYTQFKQSTDTCSRENETQKMEDAKEVVLVTGVTGSLGAHVLDKIRRSPSVAKVICLVRGKDTHEAYTRVEDAFRRRQMAPMCPDTDRVPIVVVPAKLGDEKLGIDDETYTKLAHEATVILHIAWSVNFRMSLRSFSKDNIAGLRNLINLSLDSTGPIPPRIIFCSSTASALACEGEVVPEEIILSPTAATDTGYSRSKWAAEQICDAANRLPLLRGRVTVLRIGQLSGDTQTGVWNAKEAWPMMLSTVKLVGCLPQLAGQALDWLPVDLAAEMVIDSINLREAFAGQDGHARVLHVLNDHREPTWDVLLRWLRKHVSFDIVQPSEWLRKLESMSASGSENPSLQLLDHWRQTLRDPVEGESISYQANKTFAMTASRGALPGLRRLSAIDESYFSKLWAWIDANVE